MYRTLYPRIAAPLVMDAGLRFTSYLVWNYARDVAVAWGGNGAIDLGLVDAGGGTDFTAPAELLADADAASAAGVPWEHVQVYSLDGLVTRDDPPAWLAVPAGAAAPPPDDGATERVRERIRGLDALLR